MRSDVERIKEHCASLIKRAQENAHLPTKGPYRINDGGAIVTDVEVNPFSGHDDVHYYGGYLICESVWRNADQKLLAASWDYYKATEVVTDRLSAVVVSGGTLQDFITAGGMRELVAAHNKATIERSEQ